MSKTFLYLSTLALFISCKQNQNPSEKGLAHHSADSVTVLNDPKINLNIQTNNFSEIDSSGVLMFPLSMGETEGEDDSFSYKRMPNNTYWNIIFYNSDSKAYHLLSERKMLIGAIEQKYGSESDHAISNTKNCIFYAIRTDDLNKDGKLTADDPQYLFISDKSGHNFKQISPSNYHLNNWELVKSSNKVIMTLAKDSDNNAKFDEDDEITTFEFELGKDSVAREIFPDSFKNKLKILFDKDWKRLKK